MNKNFGKVLDAIGIHEEKSTEVAVQPTAAVVPPPSWHPTNVWTPPSVSAPNTATATEQQKDQHYYPILLAKTSPSETVTPALAKVMQSEKLIANIIPDRTTRMRAAIASAGVTVETVAAELQKLGDALALEGQGFQQEVERKKAEITQKQSQATTLEQQLHDLRVEINERTNKMDQASVEFQGAYAHREAEIQQLKSESSNWR